MHESKKSHTYIRKGPSAGVTLTSLNWREIVTHLWFPGPHHILIREKDWDDIRCSDHPLMPFQNGLTREGQAGNTPKYSFQKAVVYV